MRHVESSDKQDQPSTPTTDAAPQPANEAPALPELDRRASIGREIRRLDQGIERELEAALSGLSDRELYGDPAELRKRPKTEPGPKKGRVLAIREADVFVQVPGGRSQGVLPLSQFGETPPAIGSEVEVQIEGYDEANGLLLLTRKGAAVQADWSSVAPGMIVDARVTGTNKGGLAVEVSGIRAFMPISQVDLYRVENVEQFVNQRLKCLVTEVNPEERNLVVSRRALLEKEREENRERLWQELAEGQIRPAVVRSVRDFGAFVDLGGVDALLHISEMSWTRVSDATQVVQPGQTIEVIVLKIDRETRKVSVGLKQLTASPWDNASLSYPPNTVVRGKVTRLTEFGAFVELEPGIEGLVHISELAPQRVRRPQDVVQAGQEVQVLVLRVDAPQRKISLSLKAAAAKQTPEEPAAEPEPEAAAPSPRRRDKPLRGGLGSR